MVVGGSRLLGSFNQSADRREGGQTERLAAEKAKGVFACLRRCAALTTELWDWFAQRDSRTPMKEALVRRSLLTVNEAGGRTCKEETHDLPTYSTTFDLPCSRMKRRWTIRDRITKKRTVRVGRRPFSSEMKARNDCHDSKFWGGGADGEGRRKTHSELCMRSPSQSVRPSAAGGGGAVSTSSVCISVYMTLSGGQKKRSSSAATRYECGLAYSPRSAQQHKCRIFMILRSAPHPRQDCPQRHTALPGLARKGMAWTRQFGSFSRHETQSLVCFFVSASWPITVVSVTRNCQDLPNTCQGQPKSFPHFSATNWPQSPSFIILPPPAPQPGMCMCWWHNTTNKVSINR
ncbi:hypothetical protein FN846DRAFT_417799 [Sphaerosporella brunnea]|uniref:Uncharacterized protein n=1 Tax=Sphaerosporella brunnea TaxID=1250544 RepID=A0A5J5EGI7_9PEZI|nr:hypothetical protein FN846DRAFT_417799 [Sphaerosporella brunnea]